MKRKEILSILGVHVTIGKNEILKGVSFNVKSGEIHAIMGPNGSGKSTLAYAMMGHPAYTVGRGSKVMLGGVNLLDLVVEDRAKKGLFLALQSPIAVPGVSVTNLLRTSYQELHRVIREKEKQDTVQNPLLSRRWKAADISLSDFMELVKNNAKALKIEESFLLRGIHDGFSGGEKKKVEMLQALTTQPKFAIFDEIDTGLDVDALKLVAGGISLLAKRGTGVIIVTHYQRILKYLKPDVVHILVKGKIVKIGTASLAKEIEDNGYEKYLKEI
jgi:Fe-S cluster assembly ATP-binding protein